ncbi:MAG: hypothetical protein R2699_01800 [Acidimicrobiales bacterium]
MAAPAQQQRDEHGEESHHRLAHPTEPRQAPGAHDVERGTLSPRRDAARQSYRFLDAAAGGQHRRAGTAAALVVAAVPAPCPDPPTD